eukprot:COSAG02_NODE_3118_length_7331_cov_70.719303_4_plen_175_part_00
MDSCDCAWPCVSPLEPFVAFSAFMASCGANRRWAVAPISAGRWRQLGGVVAPIPTYALLRKVRLRKPCFRGQGFVRWASQRWRSSSAGFVKCSPYGTASRQGMSAYASSHSCTRGARQLDESICAKIGGCNVCRHADTKVNRKRRALETMQDCHSSNALRMPNCSSQKCQVRDI